MESIQMRRSILVPLQHVQTMSVIHIRTTRKAQVLLGQRDVHFGRSLHANIHLSTVRCFITIDTYY
jgi:hypothetical protein